MAQQPFPADRLPLLQQRFILLQIGPVRTLPLGLLCRLFPRVVFPPRQRPAEADQRAHHDRHAHDPIGAHTVSDTHPQNHRRQHRQRHRQRRAKHEQHRLFFPALLLRRRFNVDHILRQRFKEPGTAQKRLVCMRQRLILPCRRRIARKRRGNLIGAVDCKQFSQKNQMEAARIDMAERTQLQAFFRRNALVVEINAVAAHILDDPAVAVFCQDKMNMADIRAIEPDISLLSFSDHDARQPMDAEFFKL